MVAFLFALNPMAYAMQNRILSQQHIAVEGDTDSTQEFNPLVDVGIEQDNPVYGEHDPSRFFFDADELTGMETEGSPAKRRRRTDPNSRQTNVELDFTDFKLQPRIYAVEVKMLTSVHSSDEPRQPSVKYASGENGEEEKLVPTPGTEKVVGSN